MTQREVANSLKGLIGEWTTVREELAELVEYFMTDDDEQVRVEDFGEYIAVEFEDDNGEDREVLVYCENAGSTWYISKVA